MKKCVLTVITLLFFCITPFNAFGGDFDGTKDLMCACMRVIECSPDGDCSEAMVEDVGIPQFLQQYPSMSGLDISSHSVRFLDNNNLLASIGQGISKFAARKTTAQYRHASPKREAETKEPPYQSRII